MHLLYIYIDEAMLAF